MQGLIVRVDFNAHRFQGGYSQQGFGVFFAKHDGSPDEFPHEFYLCSDDVHSDFSAVGQTVYSFPSRNEANGLQVLSGHQAVGCASVY